MSEEMKEEVMAQEAAMAPAAESEGREEDRDARKAKTFYRKKVCRFCANKLTTKKLTIFAVT